MRRFLIIPLLFMPAEAKIGITQIAAGTTIAVNVITIKETVHRARQAANKTKKVVGKVARKVSGK